MRGDPTQTGSVLCAQHLVESGETPEPGASCEVNADCGSSERPPGSDRWLATITDCGASGLSRR